MDDATFVRVREALATQLGLDLQAYKQQQMRRRIDSFILRQCEGDLESFLSRVKSDSAFLQAVRDMLTINVTEFFRDPLQWAMLERDVLPSLRKGRPRLRIWSAGCSHGQEPISLAIALDRLGALGGASILASDFDRAALERTANGGPYRLAELAGISEADRARYFVEDAAGFRATQRVRSHVSARSLNLLADAFEADYDLIVCRNVMIYFEPAVKTDLIRRFHAALRPGGVLFIGATEALLGADLVGFERLGGNFYRRAATGARSPLAA